MTTFISWLRKYAIGVPVGMLLYEAYPNHNDWQLYAHGFLICVLFTLATTESKK